MRYVYMAGKKGSYRQEGYVILKTVTDDITISELIDLINYYKKQNPDKEIFFDGDSYSICMRNKEKEVAKETEGKSNI